MEKLKVKLMLLQELKLLIDMAKIAFKMKLKPGFEAEYQKRHDKIWPEVKALLKANGVSDYAIFHDRETNFLFAVQNQDGRSSQDLGNHDIVQKWWAYMADIMETNSDQSPVSNSLDLLFHLE